MSRNYVKSTIESGDGSGDLLTISDIVKAARVTEYSIGGVAFPRSAAKYSHSTPAGTAMSVDYCYIGSNTKTIEIDFMEVLIAGVLDSGDSAFHYSFKLEIVRCNFSSADVISGGSYAYSAIVPFDSNDSASTMTIKLNPTGLSNQETLFSGYFHCSQFTTGAILFQSKFKVPFGRDAGKPVFLSGDTQAIIPQFSTISGSNRGYLLGSIYTNWHET